MVSTLDITQQFFCYYRVLSEDENPKIPSGRDNSLHCSVKRVVEQGDVDKDLSSLFYTYLSRIGTDCPYLREIMGEATGVGIIGMKAIGDPYDVFCVSRDWAERRLRKSGESESMKYFVSEILNDLKSQKAS